MSVTYKQYFVIKNFNELSKDYLFRIVNDFRRFSYLFDNCSVDKKMNVVISRNVLKCLEHVK